MAEIHDWDIHYLPDCECFLRLWAGDSDEPTSVYLQVFDGACWTPPNGQADWPDWVAYRVNKKNWKRSGDDLSVNEEEDINLILDRAESTLKAQIKWDGCSHFNFGDENGYLHICGVREGVKLALLIEHCFEIAWHFYLTRGVNENRNDFYGKWDPIEVQKYE